MKNKLFTILFFIYCCVFAADIDFKVLKFPEKVKPGSQYTLFFRLQNNGQKPARFYSYLQLPDNWSIVTKKKIPSIKPGSYANFFYTINVPKNTLAGKDQINLTVRNSNKEKIINQDFEVEIIEIHNIEISVISKPAFVIGADEFSCEYLIKNLGNGVEKLTPSSKTGTLTGENIVLPPLTTTTLKVIHSAPPSNAITPYDFFPDFNLYLISRDSIVRKFTDIKIYPKTGKSDPYFRFPIEAGFFYNSLLGNNKKSSIQYKFNGSGYLDKKGKHHIEIIADSETNEEFSRIGNFRRTSVNYENPFLQLNLLDFYANPSTLMEKSRWGQGAKFEIRNKTIRSEAFYITPRFFPDIKREYGTTTTYNFNDRWKVKGGWISKTPNADSLGISNLFSISAEYNDTLVQSNLELSESINRGDLGFACYNKLAFKNEKIRYRHEFIHADENYKGYYQNSIFINSSFSYSFNRSIGFQMSGNYNSTNESMDTILSYTAPIFKTFATGFRYRFANSQSFQLNFTFNQKKDRSKLKRFYFRERAIRGTYYYRRRKLNIQLNSSFGKNQNLRFPEEEDQWSFESGLIMRYNLHKRASFSSSIKYLDNNKFSGTNENQSDLFFGCNLFYRAKKSLSLAIQYKNEYVADEAYQLKSFFGGSVNYQISDFQKISFDANYVGLKDSDEKEVYLSAQYVVQINAPLYKSFNAGHLEGKIISEGAEKIEGIVIGLNEGIAISDKNGYFQFNNLKPGKYFLTAHSSSFGKNDITEFAGPFEIDILPKSVSEFELKLIKSSTIKGKVQFNKGKQFGLKSNETDETKVVIELKNNKVSLYTITDNEGNFYFGNLRPGPWEISIVDDNLKKKYSIPNNHQKIGLESGKTKSVKFLMKPKKRNIHMGKKKFKL